jgi:hypothetical protein
MLRLGFNIIPMLNFVDKRNDTFYLEEDPYISETDESIVAGYSGISVDHNARKVTITQNHTIEEVYDYLMHIAVADPTKEYPEGIIETNNGTDYKLWYDLEIDGCFLEGEGKYIDMRNNDKTLVNGGDTNIRIWDIDGLVIGLTVKVFDINSGSPINEAMVRVVDGDNNEIIKGYTDSQGIIGTSYTYSQDVDVYGRVRRYNPDTNEVYVPNKFISTITNHGMNVSVFLIRD